MDRVERRRLDKENMAGPTTPKYKRLRSWNSPFPINVEQGAFRYIDKYHVDHQPVAIAFQQGCSLIHDRREGGAPAVRTTLPLSRPPAIRLCNVPIRRRLADCGRSAFGEPRDEADLHHFCAGKTDRHALSREKPPSCAERMSARLYSSSPSIPLPQPGGHFERFG